MTYARILWALHCLIVDQCSGDVEADAWLDSHGLRELRPLPDDAGQAHFPTLAAADLHGLLLGYFHTTLDKFNSGGRLNGTQENQQIKQEKRATGKRKRGGSTGK